MKKKITRPDGTVEEIEGTAEEFVELEKTSKKKNESKDGKEILKGSQSDRFDEIMELLGRIDDDLKRAQPPVVVPDPWKITWYNIPSDCLIEQFFRDNPNERFCMISCPCPKCAVHCSVERDSNTYTSCAPTVAMFQDDNTHRLSYN